MALYVMKWTPPAARFSRLTSAPHFRAVSIESSAAFETAVSRDLVNEWSNIYAAGLITVFVEDAIREFITELGASVLNGGLEALNY